MALRQLPVNIDLELLTFDLGPVAPRVERIPVLAESLQCPGDLVVDLDLSWPSAASLDFRLRTDL